VGAFATDLTLSDADLELVASAQRGDKLSLRRLCQRFKTPLLAMVLHHTGDWEHATEQVEPLLEILCRELLRSEILATDWSNRAAILVAQQSAAAAPQPAENGSGLEGLGAVARVVKRRTLRAVLPKLPLPELMVLLLVYLDARRPDEMAGLVASTSAEAAALIVKAHQAVQSELAFLLQSAGVQP
jgi:hypothetical protein